MFAHSDTEKMEKLSISLIHEAAYPNDSTAHYRHFLIYQCSVFKWWLCVQTFVRLGQYMYIN